MKQINNRGTHTVHIATRDTHDTYMRSTERRRHTHR